MIAPLAKLMDWSVLQAGYAMLSLSMLRESTNERDLKLEQAVQFLNGPDFIPAESQPARLDLIPDASGGRFRFPTPQPSEFAEKNVVHGRLSRCADAWRERPVIVLLHCAGRRLAARNGENAGELPCVCFQVNVLPFRPASGRTAQAGRLCYPLPFAGFR